MFKLYLKPFLALNIYTNCCIPKRFSGYNVGPINFIRPQEKDDLSLVCHELKHTEQFWRNPITYCLGRWIKWFKFLPKSWRDWSERKTFEFECEGYGVSLQHVNPDVRDYMLDVFAEWVITKYNLTLFTKQEAKERILYYFKNTKSPCKVIGS